MALEGGTFAFGAAVLPLTASTTNSLLRDADPALATALDFFSWGIQHYVGDRLIAQAALHGYALPSAIGITIGVEPSPFLFADQFKFPIFSLYRKKDDWDEHTVIHHKSTSTWEFSYVLPPLTPLQQDALNPILRVVTGVLHHLSEEGCDPGYLGGALVSGEGYGLVQKVDFVGCSYGGYEKLIEDGQYYRAVTGTFRVREREMFVRSAYDLFDGADGSIGVDDLTDVVDILTGDALVTESGSLILSEAGDELY